MKDVIEVIDALGGTVKVAELFGVGKSAVSNWRAANRFPARLHLRILRETAKRGIPVGEEVFREDRWETF